MAGVFPFYEGEQGLLDGANSHRAAVVGGITPVWWRSSCPVYLYAFLDEAWMKEHGEEDRVPCER